MKVNWQNKEIVRIKIKNKRFSRFLFENSSLSRLIRDQFRGRFHIDLISESWCIAMKSEKNYCHYVITKLLSLGNHT